MNAKFGFIAALILIAGCLYFAGTAYSDEGGYNYTCRIPNGASFGSEAPCLDYHGFTYPQVFDYPGYGNFYFENNPHHFTDPYQARMGELF
jgi:hypothetical protein